MEEKYKIDFKEMNKQLLLLILSLLFGSSSYSQMYYTQSLIYSDSLDDNKGGWEIEDEWNSTSSISNGKLTHYFRQSGYSTINLTDLDLDTINGAYMINIRANNLNNRSETSYYEYRKKDNGAVKKELKMESNPRWGITWAFKDWDNYEAILFQSREEFGMKSAHYKVISVINGEEIIHQKWKANLSLAKETGYNEISIKFSSGYCSIYFGLFNDYKEPDVIYQTKSVPKRVGILVNSPAKVSLDYLTVERLDMHMIEHEEVYYNTKNYNVPYIQIVKVLEQISESEENGSIWVNTLTDGSRYFHIDRPDIINALPNDERILVEFLAQENLKLLFHLLNYTKEEAIPLKDLVEVFKTKGLKGFQVKTGNDLHTISWDELELK